MSEPSGSLRKECLGFSGRHRDGHRAHLADHDGGADRAAHVWHRGQRELAGVCVRHADAVIGGAEFESVRQALHVGRLDVWLHRDGSGHTAGNVSGWCLVWAYSLSARPGWLALRFSPTPCWAWMGLHLPSLVLFAICAITIWTLAYRDIQLSSILMLVLEGLSVALDPAAVRDRAIRREVGDRSGANQVARRVVLGPQSRRGRRDFQPGRL